MTVQNRTRAGARYSEMSSRASTSVLVPAMTMTTAWRNTFAFIRPVRRTESQ